MNSKIARRLLILLLLFDSRTFAIASQEIADCDVADLVTAARTVDSIALVWDVERHKNVIDAASAKAQFLDCGWFAKGCCFRVHHGLAENRQPMQLEAGGAIWPVDRVRIAEGRLRTRDGRLLVLHGRADKLMYSQLREDSHLFDSAFLYVDVNPILVFWWISENAEIAAKNCARVSSDELLVEIPELFRRCSVKKDSDGHWYVEKIESFSASGSPVHFVEYSLPLHIEGTALSVGATRRVTFLSSSNFRGRAVTLAPQSARLITATAGPIPPEFFEIPDAATQLAVRRPSPGAETAMDRYRRTGVKPADAAEVAPPTWNWPMLTGLICGVVILGVIVLQIWRKPIGN